MAHPPMKLLTGSQQSKILVFRATQRKPKSGAVAQKRHLLYIIIVGRQRHIHLAGPIHLHLYVNVHTVKQNTGISKQRKPKSGHITFEN